MMRYTSHYSSPLGDITLGSDGRALTGLWFDGQRYFGLGLSPQAQERDLPVFQQARRWLDAYCSGRDPGFLPPLALDGTPFQKSVWAALGRVPYGHTVTYGELARAAGASSARAVGGAVGRNPISLIVPCHRVVGRGGRLTGYAGGLDRKARLLALEGADLQGPPAP